MVKGLRHREMEQSSMPSASSTIPSMLGGVSLGTMSSLNMAKLGTIHKVPTMHRRNSSRLRETGFDIACLLPAPCVSWSWFSAQI